ncbi:MAG: DUF6263 family protein [Bacillota bacterium]
MKKFLFTLGVISLLVLAAATVSAESYDLKLNLETGDTYTLDSSITQEINYQMMDMDIYMNQEIIQELTFKVSDITDKGNYKMQANIKNIEFIMHDSNFPMENDLNEEEIDKEELLEEMNRDWEEISKAMENKEFSITLSPRGKVVAQSGLNELMSDVSQVSSEEIEMDNLDEDFFEQSWDHSFVSFPEHSVSPGDSWEDTLEMQMLMEMEMTTNYTLEEFGDQEIILDQTSDIDFGNLDPTQILGDEAEEVEMDFNMDGNQEGQIILFEDSMWIKEAQTTQKLEGEIIMTSPAEGESFAMPFNATSKISISGNKK